MYWRKNLRYGWDFSAPPVTRSQVLLTPSVTLHNKLCSCEICRVLNVEPLVRIKISQLRNFNHVSKMPHERLARHVMLAKHTVKRPSDLWRPRWNDCISDLACYHLGVEPAELSEIAVDREVFHVLLGLLPQWHSLEDEINEMNNIYVIYFIHQCLKVLS